MDRITVSEWELYQDIKERTKGEIYVGVVGPVRTGKSTFIKRFMELCVLPHISDETLKTQTVDELPQAAVGKTVMTMEPKFVPAKAILIPLQDDTELRVRLIDCVGFMVQGAEGHLEEGKERMVRTPWYDTEVPFSKAAQVGTEKVIKEHSTLGIVMTTDGSFTGIPRYAYESAEKETIEQLKQIGKPFLIVLNCQKPYSEEAKQLAIKLKETYGVCVICINAEQMSYEEALSILRNLLYEFPVNRIEFEIPRWTQTLSVEHKIYNCLIQNAKKIMTEKHTMRQILEEEKMQSDEIVESISRQEVDLALGKVVYKFQIPDKYYYENISELTGQKIEGEYELIDLIRNLSKSKELFEKVKDAYNSASQGGYGVITPNLDEIVIEDPQIVKHGNKYGIQMKALSPSIHLIKATIETEIAPIIGSKEQAEGLLSYMKAGKEEGEDGMLNVNIFGKTVGELVEDGMRAKIGMMDGDSQQKLQDTMQKIVNDKNGGMICIII